MCARGGYGAIRLLNHIDYNLIKNNQKVFCGFSDVTALLLMIYKKTGMITYHGPMACSDFGCENGYEFSLEYFEKAICRQNLEFEGNKIYTKGSAEGIIWGGNLATVVLLFSFPLSIFQRAWNAESGKEICTRLTQSVARQAVNLMVGRFEPQMDTSFPYF